jgi:hypothetical protein
MIDRAQVFNNLVGGNSSSFCGLEDEGYDLMA